MSNRCFMFAHNALWRWKAIGLAVATIALVSIPSSVYAAVTVTSFTAQAQTSQIVLTWKTVSEVNNAGFNMYRSTSPNGPWTDQINAQLIPAQCPFCPASDRTYSFTDTSVNANQTYYYKLGSVDFNNTTQQFGPVSASLVTPPTATATAPPPTPTTVAPTATETPLPSNTATVSPAFTRTPAPLAAVVSSPTRTTKVARANAGPTPEVGVVLDGQPLPTPAVTLVALGIKDTPVPEMDSSQTGSNTLAQDSTHTRSYYLLRLIDATLFLTASSLVFASFVLGAVSVYLFLRAYLR